MSLICKKMNLSETHFHMKGFAQELSLKQRRNSEMAWSPSDAHYSPHTPPSKFLTSENDVIALYIIQPASTGNY